MPTVCFKGQQLVVPAGANLRKALREAGLSPHSAAAEWANCRGFGTCGTCALDVEGPLSPVEPDGVERWRLGFPPHDRERGLRLACQVRVEGDLTLRKRNGFWGQGEE